MKNDNFSNTAQMDSVIIKSFDNHDDKPMEIFTDLFFLTSENKTDVDAGGACTQTLDAFSRTLCHDFYLNTIICCESYGHIFSMSMEPTPYHLTIYRKFILAIRHISFMIGSFPKKK